MENYNFPRSERTHFREEKNVDIFSIVALILKCELFEWTNEFNTSATGLVLQPLSINDDTLVHLMFFRLDLTFIAIHPVLQECLWYLLANVTIASRSYSCLT